VVATTRVETMLGDTAIAVHPDDERYRHLVGKTLPHPFLDRSRPSSPTITSTRIRHGRSQSHACTRPNDFEIGLRHSLPMPNIMDTKAVSRHGTDSTDWIASTRVSRCGRRWRSRAASSPRSGHTCTVSAFRAQRRGD